MIHPDGVPVARRPKLYIGEQVLELPEPEWLLPGFVQKGGLTVLYGEPGAGKSLLMLDWANTMQMGWKWMGRQTEKAKALYLMAEGQYGLRGRVLAWKENRQALVIPDVAYSLETTSLWTPPTQTEKSPEILGLIDVVESFGIDVVFVDTLAATFGGGNENSQQDMNQWLGTLRKFQERGTSVVVAHHVTKEKHTLRGSTVLSGAADTMVRLEPKRSTKNEALIEWVTAYCDKQKDFIPFSPFRMKVNQITLGEREDGTEWTSVVYTGMAEDERREAAQELLTEREGILEILAEAEDGLAWTKELIPQVSGSTSQLTKAREDLEREGRIYKDGGRWYLTVPKEIEEL